MSIRADKVNGLVPEQKKTGIEFISSPSDYQKGFQQGKFDEIMNFNKTISEIGSKDLKLDKDVIREIIDDMYDVDNGIPNWDSIAQAITDSIGDILKVKDAE